MTTPPPQPGRPWQSPEAPPYPGQPQAAPYRQGGAPNHAAPQPQTDPRMGQGAYPAQAGPYAQPGAPQPYGQAGAPQHYAQPGAPMPGGPAPAGAPAAWGGPAVQCRFCGCVPAAQVTFRGHRGMIIIMQFLRQPGPFCRDCGLATFRSMTARTLLQGWWGYFSFIITPFTVLTNLVRRGKVAGLPAPTPPPSGQHKRPMDPGAPLFARPMALAGLAIPFVALILLITEAALSGQS